MCSRLGSKVGSQILCPILCATGHYILTNVGGNVMLCFYWLFWPTQSTCQLDWASGPVSLVHSTYHIFHMLGSLSRCSTDQVQETRLCNSGATLWLVGTTPLIDFERKRRPACVECHLFFQFVWSFSVTKESTDLLVLSIGDVTYHMIYQFFQNCIKPLIQ